MLIPYQFKLGDKNFHVVFNNKMPERGKCWPDIGLIELRYVQPKRKRVKSIDLAETFWHEATHAILHDMGHRLCSDETFVTEFSKRLNQLVHTAKLP